MEDKPRRLESDTIKYVTSLSPALAAALADTDPDLDSTGLLVDNVLDELKSRLASVAADRNTHAVLEDLCQLATLPQLLTILYRLSSYAVFLASNRHASHILQTVLCRVVFLQRAGESDERSEQIVLAFARPLVSEVASLASDISASHVLRSLVVLMAGLPVVGERKGKGSKHKHSMGQAVALDSLLDPLSLCVQAGHFRPSPPALLQELARAADLLRDTAQVDLLSICVSASGCAVLGLLVRVLYGSDAVLPQGSQLAEALVDKIVSSDSEVPGAGDVVYGLAGERGGSYFLEAALECCSADLLVRIVRGSVLGRAAEYAADGSANFVLQSILRRLSLQIKGGGEDHRAEELRSVCAALVEELSGGGTAAGSSQSQTVIGELLGSRGGLVMWLLSCAAALCDGPLFETLAAAVLVTWTQHGAAQLSDALWGLLREDKAASNEVKFDVNRGQLIAARIVKAVLVYAGDSASRDQLLRALSLLPRDAVTYIATHGQLSKLLLDTVFEMQQQQSSSSADVQRLVHAVVAISGELAAHFIGQHVLKRCFDFCGATEKELIAGKLVVDRARLDRTKEGRASLRNVGAEEYERDAKEWRSQLLRRAKAELLIQELEGVGSGSAVTKAGLGRPSERREEQGDGEGEGVRETGKRKRKRKRAGQKSGGGNDDDEEPDN